MQAQLIQANLPVRLCFVGALLALSLCVTPASGRQADEAGTTLILMNGFEADGHLESTWIEAVLSRHDAGGIQELRTLTRSLPPDERSWVALIGERIPTWRTRIDSLSIPFGDVDLPDTTIILLGHAGGADAFTYSDAGIGFDVSRLQALYGDAAALENSDRIDRFFAHEMTHIVHKAWGKRHPMDLDSPLAFALWDCMVEGIGNYRSLSDKWVNASGELTPYAEEVLAELQRTFVQRIAALSQVDEAEAAPLLEGLSIGPFTKKWGALTSALWLAQEARGDDSRLKKWIEVGPPGILGLARKYLPPEQAEKLEGLPIP
jgi:hypothetical protein